MVGTHLDKILLNVKDFTYTCHIYTEHEKISVQQHLRVLGHAWAGAALRLLWG